MQSPNAAVSHAHFIRPSNFYLTEILFEHEEIVASVCRRAVARRTLQSSLTEISNFWRQQKLPVQTLATSSGARSILDVPFCQETILPRMEMDMLKVGEMASAQRASRQGTFADPHESHFSSTAGESQANETMHVVRKWRSSLAAAHSRLEMWMVTQQRWMRVVSISHLFTNGAVARDSAAPVDNNGDHGNSLVRDSAACLARYHRLDDAWRDVFRQARTSQREIINLLVMQKVGVLLSDMNSNLAFLEQALWHECSRLTAVASRLLFLQENELLEVVSLCRSSSSRAQGSSGHPMTDTAGVGLARSHTSATTLLDAGSKSAVSSTDKQLINTTGGESGISLADLRRATLARTQFAGVGADARHDGTTDNDDSSTPTRARADAPSVSSFHTHPHVRYQSELRPHLMTMYGGNVAGFVSGERLLELFLRTGLLAGALTRDGDGAASAAAAHGAQEGDSRSSNAKPGAKADAKPEATKTSASERWKTSFRGLSFAARCRLEKAAAGGGRGRRVRTLNACVTVQVRKPSFPSQSMRQIHSRRLQRLALNLYRRRCQICLNKRPSKSTHLICMRRLISKERCIQSVRCSCRPSWRR